MCQNCESSLIGLCCFTYIMSFTLRNYAFLLQINTLSLRSLCWLLRFNLPSVNNNIKKLANGMFIILKNYASAGASKGENLELISMAFKVEIDSCLLHTDKKYQNFEMFLKCTPPLHFRCSVQQVLEILTPWRHYRYMLIIQGVCNLKLCWSRNFLML